MVKDKEKAADGDGNNGRKHSRLFGSRRAKLVEVLFPMSASADAGSGAAAQQPVARRKPPSQPAAASPAVESKAADVDDGRVRYRGRAARKGPGAEAARAGEVGDRSRQRATRRGRRPRRTRNSRRIPSTPPAPARPGHESRSRPRLRSAKAESAETTPTGLPPRQPSHPRPRHCCSRRQTCPRCRRAAAATAAVRVTATRESSTLRRRARRRPGEDDPTDIQDAPHNTVVKVRTPRHQPELEQ